LNDRAILRLLAFSIFAPGVAACNPAPSAEPLHLFAAAGAIEAVERIARDFERESGAAVRLNLAASSMLAQQIRSGARADVFLSANLRWVDELEKDGLVARRRELLGNRLVAVTPKEGAVDLAAPADLARPEIERLALADPESVPAGIYAKQALEALGLWESLRPRVVAAADVRQALALVERGEVEAGIVYSTDAAIAPGARVAFAFEASLTEPIRHGLALIREAESRPEAIRLYDYLGSPQAASVFRELGFEVLDAPPDPPQ
jgi:molybdate transport system substrate-binding protein